MRKPNLARGELRLFFVWNPVTKRGLRGLRPLFLSNHYETNPMTAPKEFFLNEEQARAVRSNAAKLMIVAGAGTGKTATIVARAAYLVDLGLSPHQIWMITFTQSAASELRDRLSATFAGGNFVFAGTYHALAVRLLRQYGWLIGWKKELLDAADQLACVSLLAQAGGHRIEGIRPQTLLDLWSYAANSCISLEQACSGLYRNCLPHLSNICVLQDQYRRYKLDHDYADYDDLLHDLIALLQDLKEAALVVSDCMQIMVDEYQDTSPLQQQLLDRLIQVIPSVTVVGDPMQAIYSWRGCTPALMLDRAKSRDWTVIRLHRNYRSPQAVLDKANHVVADQTDNRLQSTIAGPPVPPVQVLPTEQAEAQVVAGHIRRLLADGVSPADIAVLFRDSVHALRLELELTAAAVPYIRYGGRRITDAAHVKDMLALLRLALRDDRRSLIRVLQLVPGIGEATAVKAASAWPESRIPAKAESRIEELRNCIREMRAAFTPAAVWQAALAWYAPICEPHRQLALDQLGQACAAAESLRAWLDGLTVSCPAEDAQAKVTLSTIHWAKGREWLYVVLIRCAEGLLPKSDDPEERRLLHIAITRSKGSLRLYAPAFGQFRDRSIRYCWVADCLK